MNIDELTQYVSISEIRFLIAIILTAIFSATLKERKGLLPTLCALLLLYIAFDYIQAVYIFTAVVINFTLLFIFRFEEYSLTAVNILILYIFKIKVVDYYKYIKGTCDISGMLMLLTIKMSYLGRDYDRKKHSFSDVVGYLIFIPGLLLAPTTTFIELVEAPPNVQTISALPTFGISFVFLFFMRLSTVYFPKECLYNNEINFGEKLLNMYFYNLGQRCKFYFAWHYSHGCYIMQGFNNMLNINFEIVETATSIKDLSTGWNIQTNKWLKICYFDKLKHRGVFFASFVTFTVSALWHGIKPGYLIMFLSFCFAIPVIKGINKIVKMYIPFMFPVFSRIQMALFVMYFSTPFFLLELKDLLRAWDNVYYFGHIYCFLAIIIYLLHSLMN